MNEEMKLIASLTGIGVVVGIAKMLVSPDKLTPRIVIGRAILSGATGLAAAAAVAFIPGLSFVAQVGIACVLSSIGVSALEALLPRMLKGNAP